MGRKEEIIANIQSSAINEFTKNGLDSVSMEKIAHEANVSKRTLYKYFSNKEAIFEDIVKLLIDKVCSNFELHFSPDVPIKEQLEKIVDRKIELLTNEEFLKISKLVFIELLKSNTLDLTQLEKYQHSEEQFLNWIEDARTHKVITSKYSSSHIANLFHSILKGQIFYPVILGLKKLSTEDIKISRTMTVEFFINSFCQKKGI